MKKVLYVILALVGIYLVLCIAGPAAIKVERSATINAPADAIQAKIVDFGTFSTWSPWQEKDPNMKTTITGEAGKVGHLYSWEGNKEVGKGSMKITKVSADTVVQELSFDGSGISNVTFAFKADSAGTKVSWIMDMSVPFFGRGMMMFFKGKMDEMLGADFEKGLANLKKVAEEAPATGVANYEVKEVQWEARTYYGTKTTNLTMEKIGPFFGENLPKIMTDFGKGKIEPQSPPSCLVFSWNDANMSGDMAAAFAASKDAKIKGWEKYTVPAGKVLQVTYFGAYEKIGDAHGALVNYIKEKNLTQGLAIEEYVTDPGTEKDTAKWQTNIYYTLK